MSENSESVVVVDAELEWVYHAEFKRSAMEIVLSVGCGRWMTHT
jgi:hypothetical protein